MRYAIVSDVHGNLEALQGAFDLIASTDGLLCLGDMVGYGPNPNECVEMIRARATATVLGNHDVAAIDSFGLSYFNPTAREAMRWTQTVLTPEKHYLAQFAGLRVSHARLFARARCARYLL